MGARAYLAVAAITTLLVVLVAFFLTFAPAS
jgi:hypothetical protein